MNSNTQDIIPSNLYMRFIYPEALVNSACEIYAVRI